MFANELIEANQTIAEQDIKITEQNETIQNQNVVIDDLKQQLEKKRQEERREEYLDRVQGKKSKKVSRSGKRRKK